MVSPVKYSIDWVNLYAENAIPLDTLQHAEAVASRNREFEVDGVKYVLNHVTNPNEFYLIKKTSEIGAGPHVYATYPEQQKILMEFIDEPTITPEVAARHLKEIGSRLRDIHDKIPLVANPGPSIQKSTQTRMEEIERHYREREIQKLNNDHSTTLVNSARKAHELFQREVVALPSNLKTNIHTDLHPRNAFWSDKKGFLAIDWESVTHGHPYFDLASLSIFYGLNPDQETELLAGYFGKTPNEEELREYKMVKRVRLAYTAIVNTVWAFRVEKEKPFTELAPRDNNLYDLMQLFGAREKSIDRQFFVDVALVSLNQLNGQKESLEEKR